ncbi:ATP-binding cassette sub-family A member 3 [Glossina fuscipes]|uniref:ATP-binding cassette sub-family A member 3 n=1 Tax=Glossina fuscipes TaxID=7396 RepID=A0A9C6E441_9MUSC|nr:ATP-binding cassette sub-family A member 3 [Glossina fuscipes]
MPSTFCLLLSKNFYVERAFWKWSIVEFLSITAILAVIVVNPVTRGKYYSSEKETILQSVVTYNQPGLYDLSVFMHLMSIRKERMRMTLLYTPKNDFTTAVVNGAKIALNLRGIQDVENNDILEKYFSEQNTLAGIVFHNVDDGAVPEKLVVSLRFPGLLRTVDISNSIDERLWMTRCAGIISSDGTGIYGNVDLYLREGFLQLQHSLYIQWIKLLKNSDTTNINRGRNKEKETVEQLKDMSADEKFNINAESNSNQQTNNASIALEESGKEMEEKFTETDKLNTFAFNEDGLEENVVLKNFHPNDDDNFKEAALIMNSRLSDPLLTREQDLRQIQNEEIPLIPHIQVNSMRYRSDARLCFTEGAANLNWLLFNTLFFIPFLHLIWIYAREREEDVLAHHWIYGYTYGQLWVAHFLVSFVHFLILDLLIMVVFIIPWTNDPKAYIFHNVNPIVMLSFLILHNIIVILYAMIIACTLDNAVNCVLLGVTLWLLAYSLFSAIYYCLQDFTFISLFCLSLFCNNFFPLGMRIMKKFDLEENPNYDILYLILLTQLLTIVILMILLVTLNHFRPGFYIGQTNFFYSLLCRRKPIKANPPMGIITLDRPSAAWHNFEFGPFRGEEMVFVKNVVTTIRRRGVKHQILKNVTMRFFKGEITVILGAEENGRVSLLCLMAGWQKPELGDIYYNGNKSIYQHWTDYRSRIDICMQQSSIFDSLSVISTLRYFGRIKQSEYDREELEREVNKWLTLLSGKIKPNESVKNLSYGEKRLLVLCCILFGNTSIVLLHEPTQFLKYEDQQMFWQILREEKDDRAIIVTTTSIDEAEWFADRIGILDDGVLLAYGSPFFLKTRFGIGCDLIILKDPNRSSGPITDIINKFVPNAVPDNQVGDLLVYKLPTDKRSIYQRMLLQLEDASKNLGITNIRVSSSELSEVFMTLGMESTLKPTVPEITQTLKFINESENVLKRQQIRAMIYKKMIHQTLNILPVIMTFGLLFLILLTNHLFSLVKIPTTMENGIHLGISMEEISANKFKELTDCSYIVIDGVNEEKLLATKSHLQYLFYENLTCGNMSYTDYIRTDRAAAISKLGAVELKTPNKNFSIWINDLTFHTAPMVLNLAHNIILRNLFPDNPNRLTAIINQPIRISYFQQTNLVDNQIFHLHLAIIMGIIMPITMSCFVISLVEERRNYLLTLQLIAGIDLHIYWMVGMAWDIGIFLGFSIVYILVMALTTIEGFNIFTKLLVLLLISLHGIATLAMMYFLSMFMPKSKLRAFLLAVILQLMLGICAYIFAWDVLETSLLFIYVMYLMPTFALVDGISKLYIGSRHSRYCDDRCTALNCTDSSIICELEPNCCHLPYFEFEFPGIGINIVYMLITTAIFSFLFCIFNVYYRAHKYSLSKSKRHAGLGTVSYPFDDDDVVKERTRIAKMSRFECNRYSVLADQIEKKIPNHGKRLNTVSFALDKYMSMGIYGYHKAGKTHLIEQLVGARGFRFGEMYIEKVDFKFENKAAIKMMGFCPQKSDLGMVFSPRQLFTFLFMIRGVPEANVSEKLLEIATSLDLKPYMNTKIGDLSLAVRRKVSVAISLIAYNKVLVLDEPTKGMPAKDRRIIWNVLRYARFCGKTVIFSSNENLECETLADLIIVIDDGELLAIGSPQYLRQKYTRGFFFELKILSDGKTEEETYENLDRDVENVIKFAYFLHEDSELQHRANVLKFYIPVEQVIYSYLFGSIEKNRRRLNIAEYTINQAPLLTALDNVLATCTLREPYRKRKKHRPSAYAHSLSRQRMARNAENTGN